jgi:hypothetical protein
LEHKIKRIYLSRATKRDGNVRLGLLSLSAGTKMVVLSWTWAGLRLLYEVSGVYDV